MELLPRSQQDLVDIVRAAAADDVALALSGHGTKQGWGRAVTSDRPVSLRGFNGIIDYAPAELVLTAGAGTPLSNIKAALAAEDQHLAFEPPDLGPLFGAPADQATIGGVLATNLSGPRRPFAGAARDFFLGFSGVNGRGEIVKAGGKVVKNVTGYDLPKLIAGSFGTLVAMTEITIKVVPAPETSCSVIVEDVDVPTASQMMVAALGSTADPSGAAYLPHLSQVIFRLEGSAPSVAYRRQVLTDLLRRDVAVLAAEASVARWAGVRDLSDLRAGSEGRVVWLLSLPMTDFPRIFLRLSQHFNDLVYTSDWGGGRLWLAHGVTDMERAVRAIHSSLSQGGHATLLRAPDAWRQGDGVFAPDVPIALLQKVRGAFDPQRLFNRGRLHPDL